MIIVCIIISIYLFSAVHCAKFLLDHSKVSSFSDDKTIRVWDIGTEKQLYNFEGHNVSVYDI